MHRRVHSPLFHHEIDEFFEDAFFAGPIECPFACVLGSAILAETHVSEEILQPVDQRVSERSLCAISCHRPGSLGAVRCSA